MLSRALPVPAAYDHRDGVLCDPRRASAATICSCWRRCAPVPALPADAPDPPARSYPVRVLVDQPASRAQAPRHLPDRFLAPGQVEQDQARAHQIKGAGSEGVGRVVDDVVLDHLQVRDIKTPELGHVDIGGHDRPAGPGRLASHTAMESRPAPAVGPDGDVVVPVSFYLQLALAV
jgi:hypothetical protein